MDNMELIGQTRDDAAGEAFDKGARFLGLPYPGGKMIDELAQSGNPQAIDFTRSKIKDAPLDFSFSGLKTQLRHYVENMARIMLRKISTTSQPHTRRR